MAGTKEGAIKRRQTLIKKAGGLDKYMEQQRALAAKGGSNHNPENRGSFANRKKSERRKLAAAGGKAGKRGKAPVNAADDKAELGARRGVEQPQQTNQPEE